MITPLARNDILNLWHPFPPNPIMGKTPFTSPPITGYAIFTQDFVIFHFFLLNRWGGDHLLRTMYYPMSGPSCIRWSRPDSLVTDGPIQVFPSQPDAHPIMVGLILLSVEAGDIGGSYFPFPQPDSAARQPRTPRLTDIFCIIDYKHTSTVLSRFIFYCSSFHRVIIPLTFLWICVYNLNMTRRQIQKLIIQRGMTQTEVAKLAGMPFPQVLCSMLRGDRTAKKYRGKLAYILKISENDLP